MTTEFSALQKAPWRIFLVCLISVLAGQLFGHLLTRWMPFHYAIGAASFVTWSIVGLIFARWWRPKYGLPGWLAAILIGATAGLISGLLAYYFPWNGLS